MHRKGWHRARRLESDASCCRFVSHCTLDRVPDPTKMASLFDGDEGVMSEERRRPTAPLLTDWDNDDPYVGLPPDLPLGHSRFPIEPCTGYGDLSFDPFMRHNAITEEQAIVITVEERKAWRRAMQQAPGHLIEVPLTNRRKA